MTNDILKTRTQAIQLIRDIEESLKALYENTDKTVIEVTKDYLPQDINMMLSDLDRESANKLLFDLKTGIESMEVIHITFPFAPRESLLNDLHAELVKKIPVGILLDIDVNAMMSGGLILEREGKYFDYSLKSQVNKFLDETLSYGS